MSVTELPTIKELCQTGQRVITSEIEAIKNLLPRIGESFAKSCQLILKCKGRVIVLGLGKSGHIGKKIAATFASTGTPSYFIHPSEASHGDLGMIASHDVIVMISNSGETAEMLSLIPHLHRQHIPIIALTGRENSTLAQKSDIHLFVGVEKEAGLLGLAPTSSTTVTLVMGDALAMALLEARGFTDEDFAFYHPGGSLGKKLVLQVGDLMISGESIPIVNPQQTVIEALLEVTHKHLGMTTVCDNHRNVLGIFTDGDLRRSIDAGHDLANTPIEEVMTKQFQKINASLRAYEALNLMRQNKITSLVVLDDTLKLTGILHMHDLLRAGVI